MKALQHETDSTLSALPHGGKHLLRGCGGAASREQPLSPSSRVMGKETSYFRMCGSNVHRCPMCLDEALGRDAAVFTLSQQVVGILLRSRRTSCRGTLIRWCACSHFRASASAVVRSYRTLRRRSVRRRWQRSRSWSRHRLLLRRRHPPKLHLLPPPPITT